jgi:RNA polymerase sigma-70 factor, ECF subfamily
LVPARSTFKDKAGELPRSILPRVIRREADALEMFFDHFYDRVFAHVVNLLRNTTLAEDLTQDVFVRLHKVIDQLDPQRDPAGWVFTVATNVVRDYWRSAENRRRETEQGVDDPGSLDVAHPDPDVASVMEKDEDLAAVWAALHTLSVEDREVILLKNYEELGTAEIAGMLELKDDAVRQRHSRAIGRLGKAFKARVDTEKQEL